MRGLRRLLNIYEDCKGEYIMNIKYAGIEYKMPEAMANAYLKSRKESEKKLSKTQFLCKIVNQEFGIKGNCVNVITF